MGPAFLADIFKKLKKKVRKKFIKVQNGNIERSIKKRTLEKKEK